MHLQDSLIDSNPSLGAVLLTSVQMGSSRFTVATCRKLPRIADGRNLKFPVSPSHSPLLLEKGRFSLTVWGQGTPMALALWLTTTGQVDVLLLCRGEPVLYTAQ